MFNLERFGELVKNMIFAFISYLVHFSGSQSPLRQMEPLANDLGDEVHDKSKQK